MQNQLVGVTTTIARARARAHTHTHTHTHTHKHTHTGICQILRKGQLVLLGFPRCSTPSGVLQFCVSDCVCMTRRRSIAMLLFMEVEFLFDGGGRHRNILNVV